MNLLRERLRITRDTDGFSLVEVMVAIGIFGVITVFMVGILGSSMSGIMHSKQRAVAVADANQTLETARSLAYVDLGLNAADATLAADPAISTITSTNRTFGGEPVVWAANAVNHPFVPHTQEIQRPPSSLTRKTYVTGVDTTADGQPDIKRVTVIVSWARQGVRGASNSVSAATVVSPRSPGTLGNPPLGAPGGAALYPPLYGETTATSAGGLIEVEVGSGSSLDDATDVNAASLRITGANGNGTNLLNAATDVRCAQQDLRLESRVLGIATATAAGQATATAHSVSDPGPNSSSSNTQSESTAGIAPSPLSVSTPSLIGARSCTASGVTNGASLPSESGNGSLTSVNTSLATVLAPLTAPLGSIAPLELSAISANQSVTQTTPANKHMNSSASTGVSDLKVLRQTGLIAGVLNLGASEGLVHVTAFQATAAASADSTAGSTSVVTNPLQPLTVRIWDNGVASDLVDQNGTPIVCDSHSGSYCVLTPSTTTAKIVKLDKTYCLALVIVCQVQARVQIDVTINPVQSQTTTIGQFTRVYRSDYTPITITSRIRANNFGSSITLLDARVTADTGSIASCSKYGFLPGGCG